jgi:hypothetical protein
MTRHVRHGIAIETTHAPRPGLPPNWRWAALEADRTDADARCGYGATEEEAIADLLAEINPQPAPVARRPWRTA